MLRTVEATEVGYLRCARWAASAASGVLRLLKWASTVTLVWAPLPAWQGPPRWPEQLMIACAVKRQMKWTSAEQL